jgi:membrane protease YdiL (CAAX protease family)
MSTPTSHPQGPLQEPRLPEDAAPGDGGSASRDRLSAEPAPERGVAAGDASAVWTWWLAPAGLFVAFALAVFGGLLVDIPAALFGVHVSSSTLPAGLEIADTAVQDAAFIFAAVVLAHVGGRSVRAWQFGLRRPRMSWRRVLLVAIPATYLTFFLFDLAWAGLLHVTEKEKLLETLGANEGAALLVLSAALTCVLAPIAEEFLFRGFFFRALSNSMPWWIAAVITGAVFGLVHAGSAPAEDLVPLAFLGFALCVLYRATGSLYPCIIVHSLNNCIAFGSLEGWLWWQVLLLIAATAAVLVALAIALTRAGVIDDEPPGTAAAFAS